MALVIDPTSNVCTRFYQSARRNPRDRTYARHIRCAALTCLASHGCVSAQSAVASGHERCPVARARPRWELDSDKRRYCHSTRLDARVCEIALRVIARNRVRVMCPSARVRRIAPPRRNVPRTQGRNRKAENQIANAAMREKLRRDLSRLARRQ